MTACCRLGPGPAPCICDLCQNGARTLCGLDLQEDDDLDDDQELT